MQRAIEQQERLIALTTELKKTLMHTLFTAGLRGEPQKATEIGPVPESWEITTIGDVFKFSSGRTRPKDIKESSSIERPYPVYGGNGILGYSASYLLENPTLILGRVGEYCGCAHHTKGKSWISDNALYVKKMNRNVNSEYAREYFEFANLNQYSNRAGQPLITQGIICAVKMPFPSLEEQQQILEPLKQLERKIELHSQKKVALNELFRTLLHQLMTAQIRVHELEENV